MQDTDESKFLRRSSRPAIELFLLSAASLAFELLVIRWLSSDVRSLAVLRTFPLVACFIGLGAGFAQRDDRIFWWTPLAIFGLAVVMKLADFTGLNELPYPTSATYQWGMVTLDAGLWVYIAFYIVWIAVLLAGPFFAMMGMGARLGTLFRQFKALNAYSLNIAGSIAGSLLFSACSYFCAPPWLLLLLPSLVLAWCFSRQLKSAALVLIAVAVVGIPLASDRNVVWTPYFRLAVQPVAEQLNKPGNPPLGIVINVNQMFQQYFFKSLSVPDGSTIDPEMSRLLRVRQRYYDFPYHFKQSPADVLVLGCGTGQDVLAAVEHGAKRVDAVEIDPVVVALGKQHNPAYSTGVVNIHCTDARKFVGECQRKYDLIVFACLDSLAVSGFGSSVRIDSFVHTRESLSRTLSLLKPDGILVMSFGAGGYHWLRDRLFSTLRQAAGYDPLYFTDEDNPERWPAFVYIAGSAVKNQELKPAPELSGYKHEILQDMPATQILTDDWPYLYTAPRRVDLPYALIITEMILLTLFAGRRMLFGGKTDPTSWQMMFLGAAFLLLELQSISRLSLVYGATWLTSSVVINGVLLMILAANLLVIKFENRINLNFAYACLLVSLIGSYLLPMDLILAAAQGWEGASIVSLVTLLPMGIAGVVFALSFTRVEDPPTALGFNLLGAVGGAVVELLSTITGVRAMVLFAVVFYVCSFIFYRLSTRRAETA